MNGTDVHLTLNGESREVTRGTTVEALVRDLTDGAIEGVAVAIGDEVLPRSAWSRPLVEGDLVEVLQATQGG